MAILKANSLTLKTQRQSHWDGGGGCLGGIQEENKEKQTTAKLKPNQLKQKETSHSRSKIVLSDRGDKSTGLRNLLIKASDFKPVSSNTGGAHWKSEGGEMMS